MTHRILKLARPRKVASASNRYRIQVLDRAVHILDCFGFDHKELSVSEIGSRTGLHKSTTHRILMALEYNQLIKQNPETGKYHLGIKLFKLGNQAVLQFDLRDSCRPHLIRLMNKTRETVHLAVLDGNQVLYLDKVEGPYALRMPSRVGRHITTYCTSLGKAMLSCLEETDVKRMLQSQPFKVFTPNTFRSLDLLLADLRATRRRGYSIDDEEIEIGLRCVGAPIYDHTMRMVGAISVAAPSARLTTQKLPAFGRMVLEAAEDISRELGYVKQKRANAR
jgi:IclR family transcriptional regulator, KDG regulon repressor